MSIRVRLFIAFLLIVGIGFYFLVDWVLDDLRPRYLATMEESMVDTSTVLAAFVSNEISGENIDISSLKATFNIAQKRRFKAEIYEVIKDRLNMQVYVTALDGKVLFDSDGGKTEGDDFSRWNDIVYTMRGEYGRRTTRTDPDDPKTSTLYIASPITHNGNMVGVLTVAKPTKSITVFLRTAKRQIITAGVVAAVGVIFLGTIISIWITSPIRKLTDYANDVRDGKRTPAPRLGRSELGVLGSSLEEMRDALEGKNYIENYVQTLTHEMKGPLSAVRGAAELMQEDMPPEKQKQFLENIRIESDRIQKIVDRLLELSSLEARKMLRDVEDLDLGAIIDEVAASMNPVLISKNISLKKDIKDAITIRGERFLIREAVLNLLQNAIAYAPEGGQIGINLSRRETAVAIEITDNGPGVPDYALSRVFDRFYSLKHPETGKKSSGLGLSFVREIATLHGGEARIENLSDGGTRAIIQLPV